MGRHDVRESTLPPMPFIPQPVSEPPPVRISREQVRPEPAPDPEPEYDDDPEPENHPSVLLIVAMVCATAVAIAMVFAGHTTSVGGLIALVLICWTAHSIVKLIMNSVRAMTGK